MLNPSYSELMEKLNTSQTVDNKITSRYTIVIAASKRARQLIDGDLPLVYSATDKAVSIAVKELQEGKIIVKQLPADYVEVKPVVHEVAPEGIGLWEDYE